MSNMYLAFDTETTGLHSTAQILSVCFIVLNLELEVIDTLELYIKYDTYNVSAKALEINKINLVQHHKDAVDFKTAQKKLINFLTINKKTNRFIPIGHNLQYDINCILSNQLLTDEEYNQFISYNPLDTLVISQYYKLLGLLPTYVNLSLSSLCQFAKISIDYTQTHTSSYDTYLTIELLKFLKSKIKLIPNSKMSVHVSSPKVTVSSNEKILQKKRKLSE